MAQVERATSTGGNTYLTNTSDRPDLVGETVNIPIFTPLTIDEIALKINQGKRGLRFGLGKEQSNAYIEVVDYQYLDNGTINIPANEILRMTLRCNGQMQLWCDDYLSLASDNGPVFIGSGTGEPILLGNGDNNYIQSDAINDNTTASGANVYIDPTTAQVMRSTSALKYKKDVEDITKEYADNFFYKAKPKWYRSKCEIDENKSYYGYIADEVAEFEPRLVQFGKDNEPEGFSYDRVCALLHAKMLEQDSKIKELEQRLNKLEGING